MPKQNPYYIPKEYKKTEEVREIDSKYEIPTFEEFMKNYKSDKNLNYADLNSADIGTQKGYGPGSSQSSYSDNSNDARLARHGGKSVISFISTVASTVATPVFPAAAGDVATVIGEVGHALSSSDSAKDTWKYTSDLGQNMIEGFAIGGVANNLGIPILKKGWDLYQEFEEKGGRSRLMMNYHEYHRARGENYSSCCDVCKS